MDFEPRDYYEVAQERLSQAELLFDLPSERRGNFQGDPYALVVYLSGVAVESMLRAYRLKVDRRFDSRHDLARWFVASKLDNRLEEHLNRQQKAPQEIDSRIMELRSAVGEVSDVWRNDHRFASEKLIARDFWERKIIPRKGSKGRKPQVLRSMVRMLLKNARVVINAGVEAWT
ncbi:MAG TPA: hypothetical protein VMF69_11820 [Gemmataceae bacterium]|nr:hypothetical protein [Gemmataceae bacterium]